MEIATHMFATVVTLGTTWTPATMSATPAMAPATPAAAAGPLATAGLDWQLAVVGVLVALAAWYTARAFARQFSRADDESKGCAACPAATVGLRAREGQTAASAPPADDVANPPQASAAATSKSTA